MDDQGPSDAKRAKSLRDRPQELGIGPSEQLHARPRRVQARAEQVHDGSDLERAANRPRMRDARVVKRRQKKAESCLVQRSARPLRAEVELFSKLLEYVGGPPLRGEGPIAMLDDRQSAGSSNDSSRRRDIDRSRKV